MIDVQFIQKKQPEQKNVDLQQQNQQIQQLMTLKLYFPERYSFEFEHFQVTDILPINYETNGCANLVESFVARSTRINMQHMVLWVENNFQNVGMTADEQLWRFNFKLL